MEAENSEEPVKRELFPSTRWTLVLKTIEGDEKEVAIAELCRIYWSPVYFFIRKRGKKQHDAEDLTQSFFTQLLEREQFQRAAEKPSGGRLRSYLLKSVQNFLISQHEKDTAQKRGGDVERVSFDTGNVEHQFSQIVNEEASPEEMFDRRWAANVLDRTFTQLEQEYEKAGKNEDFALLKSTLGQTAEQVPFAEIGQQLGMAEGAARVAAFRLRKQFRAILHEEIRETTASEADFEEELTHLKKLLGG